MDNPNSPKKDDELLDLIALLDKASLGYAESVAGGQPSVAEPFDAEAFLDSLDNKNASGIQAAFDGLTQKQIAEVEQAIIGGAFEIGASKKELQEIISEIEENAGEEFDQTGLAQGDIHVLDLTVLNIKSRKDGPIHPVLEAYTSEIAKLSDEEYNSPKAMLVTVFRAQLAVLEQEERQSVINPFRALQDAETRERAEDLQQAIKAKAVRPKLRP